MNALSPARKVGAATFYENGCFVSKITTVSTVFLWDGRAQQTELPRLTPGVPVHLALFAPAFKVG